MGKINQKKSKLKKAINIKVPTNTKKSKSILWAVDPFQSEGPGWENLLSLMRALGSKEGVSIQPVYVLSPNSFNFTGDFSGPWVDRFEPEMEERLKNILLSVQIPSLLPAKILVNKRPSRSLNVKKLLEYAEKNDAEMIVMNSHGRKGLARLFLGSFAETALMMTRVPLMLVNPEIKKLNQFNKVLFATDFTAANMKAFKKILYFCKTHSAQLVIYHKLPDPIEPMVQTGVYMAGGGWVSVQQYMSSELELKEKEAQSWLSQAKKAGVDTHYFIEDKPGFITDAINQYIEKNKIDLVAIGSKSGAVSSVVIGSLARQMVREAVCPIWVLHV